MIISQNECISQEVCESLLWQKGHSVDVALSLMTICYSITLSLYVHITIPLLTFPPSRAHPPEQTLL